MTDSSDTFDNLEFAKAENIVEPTVRKKKKKKVEAIKNAELVGPKRGRGRPKNPNRLMTRDQWAEEQKKRAGRPKGMRTAVKKLEERLLSANRIELVIDSIVRAATDDDHKNQAAAWKLIMDRMAPLSHYEKNKGGDKPIIQINVSSMESINSVEPIETIETIDGETVDE